jgi:hypothetical protein
MREYKNKVVVLVSSFTICDKQAVEQTQSMILLEELRIPLDIVDGFDPSMMKR